MFLKILFSCLQRIIEFDLHVKLYIYFGLICPFNMFFSVQPYWNNNNIKILVCVSIKFGFKTDVFWFKMCVCRLNLGLKIGSPIAPRVVTLIKLIFIYVTYVYCVNSHSILMEKHVRLKWTLLIWSSGSIDYNPRFHSSWTSIPKIHYTTSFHKMPSDKIHARTTLGRTALVPIWK